MCSSRHVRLLSMDKFPGANLFALLLDITFHLAEPLVFHVELRLDCQLVFNGLLHQFFGLGSGCLDMTGLTQNIAGHLECIQIVSRK